MSPLRIIGRTETGSRSQNIFYSVVHENGINKEQTQFFPFPVRLFGKVGKENRVEWPRK